MNQEHLINTLPAILACLLLAAATFATAQTVGPYSGHSVDSRTLRTQERVDKLFEAGEFERAFTIYRHDLAPIGDKYAQYMVGYMHLMGYGVDEDPVLASAWYRLAAERASSDFLLVRDELMAGMSEPDKVRSDYLYLELREQYSDAVLLLKLVRDDLRSLTMITGSRTSGGASPVVSVDVRSGESMSAAERVRRIKSRVESRLAFMARQIGADDLPTDADDVDLERLQAVVASYVDTITDRKVAAAQAD